MNENDWLDEDGEVIREASIAEVGRYLPEMLTWETAPEAKAGDLFIFRWAKVHDIIDGKPAETTFPDVYLCLTANPLRHKILPVAHAYLRSCSVVCL